MTALKNVGKQMLAVEDAGERKEIAPGQVVDVDGRQSWANHLFVRAGWLEVISEKRKGKKEPEQQEPDEG